MPFAVTSLMTTHGWLTAQKLMEPFVFLVHCLVYSDCIKGHLTCTTQLFQIWLKESEKSREHEQSQYHQAALSQAEQVVYCIKHPEGGFGTS